MVRNYGAETRHSRSTRVLSQVDTLDHQPCVRTHEGHSAPILDLEGDLCLLFKLSDFLGRDHSK